MPPEAAPAPVAPAPTPAAPAASPKSPVPPVGSQAAHLEAARAIFPSDPAKSPPKPAAPPPAKVPEAAKPAAATPAEPAKATPDAGTPPAAPAPAATDFPEDRLKAPASPAAKAGWDELKGIVKTHRNKVMELETALAAAKSASPAVAPDAATTAELERLRTEHKTLSDRLLTLDLQNHPDFHRQYVAPREKAFAESATLLTDNGIAEKVDFGALLAKPRVEFAKAVSELASKMNSFDAQTFTANMRQAFELRGKESEALAKAGDVHKQLAQKSQQAARQAFDAVSSEVTKPIAKLNITPEMSAEERDAATAYNSSVDGIRAAAEGNAFGQLSERRVAELAYNDAILGHMVKHVVPALEKRDRAQTQIISELRAQLQALEGKKAPPAGSPPADSQPQDANLSHEERARQVWGRR